MLPVLIGCRRVPSCLFRKLLYKAVQECIKVLGFFACLLLIVHLRAAFVDFTQQLSDVIFVSFIRLQLQHQDLPQLASTTYVTL